VTAPVVYYSTAFVARHPTAWWELQGRIVSGVQCRDCHHWQEQPAKVFVYDPDERCEACGGCRLSYGLEVE
jgi:hypothetical protein